MSVNSEMLSFMDLLDLDEELVDSRLKTIMVRKSYTSKHLSSAIHLLQYKQLINIQDGIDCNNDEECNFVAKLISYLHLDNIDNVCKIMEIVLCLNRSKIVSKSEHLMQQILANMNLPSARPTDEDSDAEKCSQTLLYFKLCESIINALINCGEKITLLFLETPLENVLACSDDKLKTHFLTSTVPRLFHGVIGYNILDRIWCYLKQMKIDKENVLKTLSCLSEYYLPASDGKGNVKYESEIILEYEFWDLLVFGLNNNDPSVRKLSIYLMKRAIDYVIVTKKNINISTELKTVFIWDSKYEKKLKQIWDNFFILIESLEEKQSNIVLPSLQLFEVVYEIPNCWLNCAFKIGLHHDNTQVRLKCIEYCLRTNINSESEAISLLDALNDISLYDDPDDSTSLKQKLITAFENIHSFIHIFKAIPKVKWSPVPTYHLSKILAGLQLELSAEDCRDISQTIKDILKMPCNHVAVRKALHVNTSYFVSNCCKRLHWKEFVTIYSTYKSVSLYTENEDAAFVFGAKQLLFKDEEEKKEFFKQMTKSNLTIHYVLLYLHYHHEDVAVFMAILDEKIRKIKDVVNRQYSDKVECVTEVIFITDLFRKTKVDLDSHPVEMTIHAIVAREYKVIIQYILSLLTNNNSLSVEEIILIFKIFHDMSESLDNVDAKEIIVQLYKSSILLICDKNTDINKKVISINIVNKFMCNLVLNKYYKHEMLSLKQFLETVKNVEFNETQGREDTGRLKNVFYEQSCEIMHNLIMMNILKQWNEIKREVISFMDNVMECGGYGCLEWILKIFNNILPLLLSEDDMNFHVPPFLNRMWKGIEELKSHNQYSQCIEGFVNLITHNDLLSKAMYNNIVTLYCSKIIEYGPVKNAPLYYLVRKLNNIEITLDHGQLIYIIGEILLYSPVPRKDQRITDNVTGEIITNKRYGFDDNFGVYYNYEIQYLAVSILSKISHQNILEAVVSFIINKIDEAFKNKLRYHENSQAHRLLLTGVQHLLLLSLFNLKDIDTDKIMNWSIEQLEKMPHQPSVRVCLEWYIALHFYKKGETLKEENMQFLKAVPITSQFVILYWILKHKIFNGTAKKEEFEFVMDVLLAHTMGQMFNIRLYAQYLANKLSELNIVPSEKYSYIIEIINKTFVNSGKDKNFIKLQQDYFVHEFDIVAHLIPSFIYYFLPKYYDVGRNESVSKSSIENILGNVSRTLLMNSEHANTIRKEWISCNKVDGDILQYNFNKTFETKNEENADMMGTIQKKYIPWKNMSDVDMCNVGKKKESLGELIVVACLIDKLPNLGGMARTSEVFGVKTYVIDSLRHLQDRQFQGLSVSAERWIDIEEVRPGPPLKDYLLRKKAEGYCLVAAEQTSTSRPLQTFKFPKKSLLLLGHEKEGVPCDLLPVMDHCVEIPQQGFVRSLNVHVTAAIFIWEYTRQNIL